MQKFTPGILYTEQTLEDGCMNRAWLRFIGAFLIILACGYVLGRLHASFDAIPKTPLQIIPDTRARVPVVSIDDIQQGIMHGTASGHVRIFGENHMVVPDAQGAFAIPLSSLRRTVEIRVPDDAKFAASKNGKKYYDITSAAAARLKPETRVYFRTSEEAERAGYKK